MAMGVHADRYVPEKQRRVEALISFTRPLSNGAKGMRPDERTGFVVVLRVGSTGSLPTALQQRESKSVPALHNETRLRQPRGK
jgi:hypothetical protein